MSNRQLAPAEEFSFLSGQALSLVKAINAGGDPVVCPPKLMDQLRRYPEFAQLIDEGKIIPNIPVQLN